MTAKRAFISFAFDHDNDLRNALVGQAKYPNSPFEIVDASVRRHLSGNWKEESKETDTKGRPSSCDVRGAHAQS